MKEIDRKKIDTTTNTLMRQFVSGLYIIVFSLMGLFCYLIFEDTIKEWSSSNQYTEEQYAEMNKRVKALEREEAESNNWDKIENGIHLRTGLHADTNLQLVIGSCTSCHSAKLITQNKASRSGWKTMIRWMQETQGLPDLGDAEPKILDYLAKYYAPTDTGRRKNINVEDIEWYVLNLDS